MAVSPFKTVAASYTPEYNQVAPQNPGNTGAYAVNMAIDSLGNTYGGVTYYSNSTLLYPAKHNNGGAAAGLLNRTVNGVTYAGGYVASTSDDGMFQGGTLGLQPGTATAYGPVGLPTVWSSGAPMILGNVPGVTTGIGKNAEAVYWSFDGTTYRSYSMYNGATTPLTNTAGKPDNLVLCVGQRGPGGAIGSVANRQLIAAYWRGGKCVLLGGFIANRETKITAFSGDYAFGTITLTDWSSKGWMRYIGPGAPAGGGTVYYFAPLHGGNVVITGATQKFAVGYEITGAGVRYAQVYTWDMLAANGNPMAVDLKTLAPFGTSVPESAMAVNDVGQIAGQYMPSSGMYMNDEIGYETSVSMP